MIVVMPDTNVGTGNGLSGSVTVDQFIQQELLGTIIPYIEHNYRTLPRSAQPRSRRTVSGQPPYAGRPVHEPDRLRLLRPVQQRSPVPRPDHRPRTEPSRPDPRRGPRREKGRDQGDLDQSGRRGATGAPPSFTNALQPTLTFFDQNGITYTYVPGASIGAIYGHVWDTWRKDLVAFAPTLFRESGRHTR